MRAMALLRYVTPRKRKRRHAVDFILRFYGMPAILAATRMRACSMYAFISLHAAAARYALLRPADAATRLHFAISPRRSAVFRFHAFMIFVAAATDYFSLFDAAAAPRIWAAVARRYVAAVFALATPCLFFFS